MPTCLLCGASFSPQVPGWGNAVCGNCIAAQIELALMGGLSLTDRKPLRRASGDTAIGAAAPDTSSPAMKHDSQSHRRA
jgi:hypothetical protein